MADQESGNDRLTRMLAAATTGSTSSEGSGGGEDSFDLDDETTEEGSDEDAALPDDEDDTSDSSEDTTEEVTDESDDNSDADDEIEDEEPADEDGADEEVVEEPAPAVPAAPVDPVVAAMQQQIAFLQAQILQSQQQPPVPAAPADDLDDLPVDLVRGVLFGSLPREKFNELPQNVQVRLSKAYERYSTDEARYAKNPALRYQEQFKSEVEKTVRAIVEPLLNERVEQKTDHLIAKHLEPLEKQPQLRARAVQIFQTLPGARGDWESRDKTLEVAVKLAKMEAHERKVDASKKKVGAQKAQSKAAGGGKLKGAPTSKGNGKSGGIPDMRDNERPGDYAKRIAKYL